MSAPAPWLAHYDAGIPPTLAPYPDRTLVDYLADAARRIPTLRPCCSRARPSPMPSCERLSDALRSGARRRSAWQAAIASRCSSPTVRSSSSRSSRRWKIGAIVAPLNPIYTEQELERPLREHGVETIVTLTRFYERVKRVQPRTALKRVIATNIKEYFPPLLRMLFTLVREKRDGDRVQLAPDDHDFAGSLHSALREHDGGAAGATPSFDDPAVLLMSGGTTGRPEGGDRDSRRLCHGRPAGARMAVSRRSIAAT